MRIKSIKAEQILNSRGEPTVAATIETEQGGFRSSVPSGISKGQYEAVAVAAKEAVKNIEQIIAPRMRGADVANQQKIDQSLIEIDGSADKSRLGANAILAVSMACCRAGASSRGLALSRHIFQCAAVSAAAEFTGQLPRPCFNMLEGGVHAENDLALQEFMVVPQTRSFKEDLKAGLAIYQMLGQILQKKFGRAGVKLGSEAGLAPAVNETKQALELTKEAIDKAGYGNRAGMGLDCAASEFFKQGRYNLEGKSLRAEELLTFYQKLLASHQILFLEDPCSQDDWAGWQSIMAMVSRGRSFKMFGFAGGKQIVTEEERKVLIVGDDLTVSNVKRIKEAHEKKACSGVVLKPNQIGSVSETIEAAWLAKSCGWKIIVSHRSGETADDFIADLAVGVGAEFIKSGAPATAERMAKYNRLVKIEEELSEMTKS